MQDHFPIADSAALRSVVHDCMRQTGVFAEHLRGAFDDTSRECVCDVECLADLIDFIERTVHEPSVCAGGYERGTRTEGVLGLPIVRRDGHAGLVGGEAQLAQRVDAPSIPVADAEVQAVVAVPAPGVVRSGPGDGYLQLLV